MPLLRGLRVNPPLLFLDFLRVPKASVAERASSFEGPTGNRKNLLFPKGAYVMCMSLLILQQSAKTILRGTEEKCGSPRVRTLSGSRPPLLLRLSENSGDDNMSDVTFDSLPSSPSSATPHSQKLDHLRE